MADLLPLQFLRPAWLIGLVALPLVLWWWWRRQQGADPWRACVDPHLLPELLGQAGRGRPARGLAVVAVSGLLALLALAGPSWRSVEQPLHADRAPLVVVVDLSSASLAADLPPSRLLQARAKLASLLRGRRGGQVALVAFADDAYTVAPLTTDAANVALFLDALAPDIMPVDGSRPGRGIALAVELLQRAGFADGDVLVLTDGADAEARTVAASARVGGYRVSVLGMGTARGAPYRAREGGLAQARLDREALRLLAAAGGGRYSDWTPGLDDLRRVGALDSGGGSASGVASGARVPLDGGYWLLLPLLLLGALAFRRGSGHVLVLACLLLPWPPAQAQDAGLWRRDDQATYARSARAAAAYRDGRFEEAARTWAEVPGADAAYNRGNALARAGRYPEAVAAYDEALRLRPGMEDALANRQAVRAAMQRQPPGTPSEPSGEDTPPRDDGGAPQPGSGAGRTGAGKPGQADAPEASPEEPGESAPSPADTAPAPADPRQQREADAAQRARMERALDEVQPGDAPEPRPDADRAGETAAERERRQAAEAWLRRVPDDPGGLLRAKFRLEYERRQRSGADSP